MTANDPDFLDALVATVRRVLPGATGIGTLTRLSGGASQETWSFDAQRPSGGALPLILRRAPGGMKREEGTTSVPLETEAMAIRAAAASGVPVPEVPHVFTPEEGIGSAYLMTRVPGETLARRILRDAEFDAVRPHLARQCGAILARIHTTPVPAALRAALNVVDGRRQLAAYREIYDGYDCPHPVFELAFRWLEARMPACPEPVLVHGDFRNGNLMFGPDGVRAVLDWELVHLGDPAEDLGWICINSWRFGVSEKAVGGFGDVADMLAGYAEAGGQGMDADRVRLWTIYGTLKWGVMCMSMYQAFATGHDRSVERAAIGRRASETEIDLVNLLC